MVYATHQKGYWCYHPLTRHTYLTLDVTFLESKMFFHAQVSNSPLQGELQSEMQNWNNLEEWGIHLCTEAINCPTLENRSLRSLEHDVPFGQKCYIWRLCNSNWPGKEKKTIVNFVFWHIWKERCTDMIDHCQPSSMDTIQRASVSAFEFMDSLTAHNTWSTHMPHSEAHAQTWSPRWYLFVKLNVDMAWDTYSKKVRIGIVMRDYHSTLLHENPSTRRRKSTLMAECLACYDGCKFALDKGDWMVAFESECLGVVRSINGDISRRPWEIYLVMCNIRDLLANFQARSLSWIRQTANQAADHLATLAKSRCARKFGLHSPHPPSHSFWTRMVLHGPLRNS